MASIERAKNSRPVVIGHLENLFEKYFPGTKGDVNSAYSEFEAHFNNRFEGKLSLEDAKRRKSHLLIKKELRQWLESVNKEEQGPGWIARSKERFSYNEEKASIRDIIQNREGNCFSLTALYTLLSHRLGIPIHPESVIIDADGKQLTYDRDGPARQTLQSSGEHVVPVDGGGANWDLTYHGDGAYGPQHKKTRPMSDEGFVAALIAAHGVRLGHDEEPEKAREKFAQAVALAPDEEKVWAPKAAFHTLTGFFAPLQTKGKYTRDDGEQDLEKAVEAFSRVIEINPYNAAAHAHLSRVYSSQLRTKEAVDSANKALEIDPANKTARQVLIEIYALNGDMKKVRELEAEGKNRKFG